MKLIINIMIMILSGAMVINAGDIHGKLTCKKVKNCEGAVVYIEKAEGKFEPPKEPVEMDQKGFQFIPHILPILSGSTVKFLNSDKVPHNVFTPDYEKYNLGTWPTGQTRTYKFDKCQKFPCVYAQLCLVHPEMEAFIVVLQNPYYAVADASGKYEIKNIPAGNYTLGVWHEKLKGKAQNIKIEEKGILEVNFELSK